MVKFIIVEVVFWCDGSFGIGLVVIIVELMFGCDGSFVNVMVVIDYSGGGGVTGVRCLFSVMSMVDYYLCYWFGGGGSYIRPSFLDSGFCFLLYTSFSI